MTLSFTGHRPNKLGNDYNYTSSLSMAIYNKIKDYIRDHNVGKCIVGGALGIDTIAAIAAIKTKTPFILAIPFEGQENKWHNVSVDMYNRIKNDPLCTVHVVSPGGYNIEKMQVRNEWMVDNSDELYAVWNGDKQGGTWNCIEYAMNINKPINYHYI